MTNNSKESIYKCYVIEREACRRQIEHLKTMQYPNSKDWLNNEVNRKWQLKILKDRFAVRFTTDEGWKEYLTEYEHHLMYL
jgi:hypothetical protein